MTPAPKRPVNAAVVVAALAVGVAFIAAATLEPPRPAVADDHPDDPEDEACSASQREPVVEEGYGQMLQVRAQRRDTAVRSVEAAIDELAAPRAATHSAVKAYPCSNLRNHGSHFTVMIGVGTPPQMFDVVADTGSNFVIVASCLCQELGSCREEDKCFTGTGRSSSFSMRDAVNPSVNSSAAAVVVTFGSGQIAASPATDVVHVGQASATLTDALLLMIKKDLDFGGAFEGILGLGLPKASSPTSRPGELDSIVISRVGFFEAAGIARFSLCFNDGADGVLRMGIPAQPTALKSIGHYHWGLSFQGISVGPTAFSAPALFCTEAPAPGQETACGGIPDSGTTQLMGKAEHIKQLFSALCDQWPRCASPDPTTQSGNATEPYERFQILLLDCEEWMDETGGLESELPAIHLHLAGADGATQPLTLTGADYVIETKEEEMMWVKKHLFGIFPIKIGVPTGRTRNVCLPAFGTMDMETEKNGPVWILGTPIFYAYEVGYDMQSIPPAISFMEGPCGTCSQGAALSQELPANATAVKNSRKGKRRPRKLWGPLRLPSVDRSLPL